MSKHESYCELIYYFFCIVYRKIHKYLIKFIKKNYKYTYVGLMGPIMYIESGAQSEDRETLSKESALVNKEVGHSHESPGK